VDIRVETAVGQFAGIDFDGRGPDVLLVHGTGHNSAAWAPVGGRLVPHCRVVAIDLRGHGHRISTDGRIAEFPLPDRAARPHAITAGPDGCCWFTEWASGRVGRIAPDGHIETHPLADPASEPHGITSGPDGALWAALETGSIARLVPA
jgi:virginiamycin B lyase